MNKKPRRPWVAYLVVSAMALIVFCATGLHWWSFMAALFTAAIFAFPAIAAQDVWDNRGRR